MGRRALSGPIIHQKRGLSIWRFFESADLLHKPVPRMPESYAAGRDHTGNKADYKAQGEYNRADKRYSSDNPFGFRGEGGVRGDWRQGLTAG